MRMYEYWQQFVSVKPYFDGLSLITSEEDVTTEKKNHIKKKACGISSEKTLRHSDGRRRWNGFLSWAFLLQNIFLISATHQSEIDLNRCAHGISTPGRTWPKGDIVLEYGQPLTIYCILDEFWINSNFPRQNASDLVFFRGDELMRSEHVTIINETTIMMHVDKPSPGSDMYFCKLKPNYNQSHRSCEVVCLNKVTIGLKPMEPRNFSCVSLNWEKLVCSWEPAPNDVSTLFSLGFKLPGRIGGRVLYRCPSEHSLIDDRSPNTCVWSVFTDPMYRQVYEYYTFILNAENDLGKATFIYKFHHYAHVIPSNPVDLSVVNKTSSSALIFWRVPLPMINFPPGLDHRVFYQSQWDSSDSWQMVDITTFSHAREIYFNLTNLQYANAVYKVKVISKSRKAIGDEGWSQSSNITFKTAPTLPGLLPKIDIGSFEVSEMNGYRRDVYIYWQPIPQYLENGDQFTYQIFSVKGNGLPLDLQPNEISKTYAKFNQISLNNFTFEIVAANCKGINDHKAIIHVPNQLEIPQKPVVFTKIEFDGGIYELSWNSSSHLDIVEFTIFWCENVRERPYQCSGYLDWVHVPHNTRIYNLTVPDPAKIYQFGIAANTAQASSGIVWFSGTTIFSNFIGKMKLVSINRVESDLVEVSWELDYVGRFGTIQNFNIHYCPIVSTLNITCDDPMMVTTVKAEPYVRHGVIKNLKPHTTYVITVTVVTINGEGLHSDALYVTTLKTEVHPASEKSIFTDTPLEPANTCMTQVSNLNLDILEYKEKIKYLSHENRQLREYVLRCNEIW